ncbi:MAG: hypothetical protein A4E69_03340 [Syntrophus sp. PtaB.Bin138]|nr:MAG: hypothetical protein A4E69_03340 [Syntrophus sp. PtaB.Bin138]
MDRRPLSGSVCRRAETGSFLRGAETYAPVKLYEYREERTELLRLGNEINHNVTDVMLVVKPQT